MREWISNVTHGHVILAGAIVVAVIAVMVVKRLLRRRLKPRLEA